MIEEKTKQRKFRSDKIITNPGTKFNHLTFIQEVEPDYRPGKRTTMWLCECDCEQHNQIIVRASSVRSGHTKSCGCLQKKRSGESLKENHKWNNLTGQQIGYLKIIEQTNERRYGEIVWKCKCCYENCNNIVNLNSTEIKTLLTCGHHNVSSKGELKISILLKNNKIPFQTQITFPTCFSPITNRPLKFDFFVNNKYIIEYDGEQHYQVTTQPWDNEEQFKHRQLYDNIKNQWCKNNNIPLIHIPYTQFDILKLEDLLLETSKFIYK